MAVHILVRMDAATDQRLEALARKLSIAKAAAVRQAIAKFAEQEGIRVPADEAPHGVAESR